MFGSFLLLVPVVAIILLFSGVFSRAQQGPLRILADWRRLPGPVRRIRRYANALLFFVLLGYAVMFSQLGGDGNLRLVGVGAAVAVAAMACMSVPVILEVRLINRVRNAGFLMCPGCGYPVDATVPEGMCPECGLAFKGESLEHEWMDHLGWKPRSKTPTK